MWDVQRRPCRWQPVPCPCRQYVGPRPAQEFFTTDLDWDSAVMRTSEPLTMTQHAADITDPDQ